MTRHSLSQTQQLRPLDTAELELPSSRRSRSRRGPGWLALGALVLVAAGAGVALRQSQAQAPPPEDLRITPGTVCVVVEFRTPTPALGRVEVRQDDEDEEPESVLVDPTPTTEHRLLVRIPAGEARRIRAVTDGGATLGRSAQAPPAWRLRLASQVPAPGEGGLVELTSRPPSRGEARLILAENAGTRSVELEGSPGLERVRLPPAEVDEVAEALAYEGVAADGEPVRVRLPLLWGGAQGAARLLAEEYARAGREYNEVLLEPSEDYSALGIPVSAGARRRPAPEEWHQRLASLEAAVAWVAPARARVLAAVPPEVAPVFYREAAWVALYEAAYQRDKDGPPPRLQARAWANALVPPAEPGGGQDLLPPGDHALFPSLTGLPGNFFEAAVTRVPLLPPPSPRGASTARVWVEAGEMPPEYALVVHFGAHQVLLSPGLQEPVPVPGGIRLGARVPAAWLEGAAWLEVDLADGTFFPAPVPVRALGIATDG